MPQTIKEQQKQQKNLRYLIEHNSHKKDKINHKIRKMMGAKRSDCLRLLDMR